MRLHERCKVSKADSDKTKADIEEDHNVVLTYRSYNFFLKKLQFTVTCLDPLAKEPSSSSSRSTCFPPGIVVVVSKVFINYRLSRMAGTISFAAAEVFCSINICGSQSGIAQNGMNYRVLVCCGCIVNWRVVIQEIIHHG